jgi:hypothetical protein
MLEIQADDWACAGSPDTSACQNESAGVIGQDGAPGTGLPAAFATASDASATAATVAVRSILAIVGT